MNKPISKHALRRAMVKVSAEGHIEFKEPAGTVVDRIWHEMEKANYDVGRKRTVSRGVRRDLIAPDTHEVDLP